MASTDGAMGSCEDALREFAEENGFNPEMEPRELLAKVSGAFRSCAAMSDARYAEIQELRAEMEAMRPRLMPEGMEWLVEAWPRFEDGEPVRIGDKFECWCGEEHVVGSVSFRGSCAVLNMSHAHSFVVGHGPETVHGERVKRPAPKVLDTDGVEIRVGDTAWDKRGGYRLTVCGIYGDGSAVVCRYDDIGSSEILTHGTWRTCNITSIRPAIGADGEPVKRGDTVWCIATDEQLSEMGINPEGRRDLGDALTVDLVWAYGGELWASFKQADGDVKVRYLTHERPDSWERLEEDARSIASDIVWNLGNWSPSDFENVGDDVQARVLDLVHRAMALAGVSE